MCLEQLKKNRNWALWLSGFFGSVSLSSLVFALTSSTMTIFGVPISRNLLLLRFVVTAAASYLLIAYWAKASGKPKRKR